MRLPPGFHRDPPLKGLCGAQRGARVVYIDGQGIFVSAAMIRYPGAVRRRLEKVLKEKMRREGKLPGRTEEQRIVAKSRIVAQAKRNGKNSAKRTGTAPWFKPRTVARVANEERLLDITARYSRLGEVRR